MVGLIPIIGAATVMALGRRDGLSMDQWLIAAARSSRTPRRLVPAPEGTTAPPGLGARPAPGRGPAPGVLRLPAESIDPDGTITTGPATAATMVATTTVNIGLRTGDEQWALLGAYGRWLNSLTGPVQVVVSAQRADLTGYAARVADTAAGLANDALADAAADYADFLARPGRPSGIRCGAPSPSSPPPPAPATPPGTPAAAGNTRPPPCRRWGCRPGCWTGRPSPRSSPPPPTPTSTPTLLAAQPTPHPDHRTGRKHAVNLNPFTTKHRAADTGADSDAGSLLAAVTGPAAVEVGPRFVRVGDGYAATLIVTGYPAEVGPAWLEPLLSWPGRLDVAVHIEPMTTTDAATRLRKQRARLESSRRARRRQGPPRRPDGRCRRRRRRAIWPTGWPAVRPDCSGSACT